MAKIKAKPQPETITIRYDLHELPTAQHKAGLAGLILQIESMNERKARGLLGSDVEVPEIVEKSLAAAAIRFTSRSVQSLFDDLYSAEVVEVRSASRWPGATAKEE